MFIVPTGTTLPRRKASLGVFGGVIVALCTTGAVGCRDKNGPPRPLPTPMLDTVAALRPGMAAANVPIANYKIDARFEPAQHVITATQTLHWTNRGASTVDVLPFHLYLNAFKNEQSLFMVSSGGQLRGVQASATAGSWGYITLESVQVAGSELLAKLRYPGPGQDRTVVEVPLSEPLAPGASIDVTMRFSAQLPEVFARTGYWHDFHMVGQWFPKIGVRVGAPGFEQWDCVPFHGNSEFFADFGTYDVNITAPTSYAIAATGVLTDVKDSTDGWRTHTFNAQAVHDFAWMADPFMLVLHGDAQLESGTVDVRVWYRPEQLAYARRHLVAAVGTVEQLSKMLVPYPYSVLTVIDPPPEAADSAGGMEYATLVTTAGDHALARRGLRLPEYTTVHEVGHQWFQGILASNEHNEAWLDEGLNEWVDGHVMTKIFGDGNNGVDWMSWRADVTALRRAMASPEASLEPIVTTTDAFANFDTYAAVTYGNTMAAMMTLENVVGAEKFMAAMKQYAQTWAFKHPTGSDFFTSLRTSLGDIEWFIGPAFLQNATVELSIKKTSCTPLTPPRGVFDDEKGHRVINASDAPSTGAFKCEVLLANRGDLPVPVEIDVEFADHTVEHFTWPARTGKWHRFTFERNSPIAVVHLDPDKKIVMDAPFDNWIRKNGDASSAYRASARMAFWTQTLMQVVGL